MLYHHDIMIMQPENKGFSIILMVSIIIIEHFIYACISVYWNNCRVRIVGYAGPISSRASSIIRPFTFNPGFLVIPVIHYRF